MKPDPALAILARAKKLARQYRSFTAKPLGITEEVAEYEAAGSSSYGGPVVWNSRVWLVGEELGMTVSPYLAGRPQ
jgi:hypothetical protein